ncbi:hypothetical protein PGTUg99_032690 [Puccinia graminis f. sp. tritici]|uniref:Uncharacterized protein n=1 Tax=Puccinia graminis f. sp. tritici TaxID=56615 RepID=A0A5B0RRI5_PUCGR|nr:hypothetical protein PGTUg99_032690 [Puccinia graminis f. sp. tritici]
MEPITIIVGIIIALTPACWAPGSKITCEACKAFPAPEMMDPGKRPLSGECGQALGGNVFCKLKRKRKYYKCKDKACQAVTIKNLQCNYGSDREPCEHENRFVFEPPITENPDSEASTSGTSAQIPYYHFPIISRGQETTSETFISSGKNSKNKYHHFL